MNILHNAAAVTAILGLASAVHAGDTTTTVFDFEGTTGGWTGPQGAGGATELEATGGNPDGNLHTIFQDFGLTYRNDSHEACVQDFSQYDSVTFSMDLKVEDISLFGLPYVRPWLIELRDYDAPPAGYPYVSVYYLFEWVGPADWTTWSVTIDDPSAKEVPAGWGGTGDFDPDTFELILPPDRTFASVLEGADEVVYTTYLPDYFFTDVEFDLRLDNITIETVGGGVAVPGDVTGDGVVDTSDLLDLLASWGDCPGCAADLDGDDMVGVSDLLIVLANWT